MGFVQSSWKKRRNVRSLEKRLNNISIHVTNVRENYYIQIFYLRDQKIRLVERETHQNYVDWRTEDNWRKEFSAIVVWYRWPDEGWEKYTCHDCQLRCDGLGFIDRNGRRINRYYSSLFPWLHTCTGAQQRLWLEEHLRRKLISGQNKNTEEDGTSLQRLGKWGEKITKNYDIENMILEWMSSFRYVWGYINWCGSLRQFLVKPSKLRFSVEW